MASNNSNHHYGQLLDCTTVYAHATASSTVGGGPLQQFASVGVQTDVDGLLSASMQESANLLDKLQHLCDFLRSNAENKHVLKGIARCPQTLLQFLFVFPD